MLHRLLSFYYFHVVSSCLLIIIVSFVCTVSGNPMHPFWLCRTCHVVCITWIGQSGNINCSEQNQHSIISLFPYFCIVFSVVHHNFILFFYLTFFLVFLSQSLLKIILGLKRSVRQQIAKDERCHLHLKAATGKLYFLLNFHE